MWISVSQPVGGQTFLILFEIIISYKDINIITNKIIMKATQMGWFELN